jgi:hypothetical protein
MTPRQAVIDADAQQARDHAAAIRRAASTITRAASPPAARAQCAQVPDQGVSAIAPSTTTGAIRETSRSAPFRCGEGVLLKDRRHPGRYILVCRRCDGKGCRDCGPIVRQALTTHYTDKITAWMRANGQQQIAMATIHDVAWSALSNRQRYLARKQDVDAFYLCIPAARDRRVVVTTMPEALRSPYQLVDLDQVETELGLQFHAMPADQRRVTSSTDWAMTHKPQVSDTGAASAPGGTPEKRYDQVAGFPSITRAIEEAKRRRYYQGPMDPPEDWTEAHVTRIPTQDELESYCAAIGAYQGRRRDQRESEAA